nr:DUF2232 domain-containing protein [Thermoflavimicrobium dichotomicum]
MISLFMASMLLFAFYLLPLPVFLLITQYRLSYALGMAVLAGGVVLAFGNVEWLLFIFFALLVGVSMGHVYRKPGSTGTDVVLAGFLAGFVGILLILGIAFLFVPAFQQLLTVWDRELEQARQYWEQMMGVEFDPHYFRLNLFMPVMLFFMVAPVPIINLWLGRKWLKRRAVEDKKLPPFKDWRLPKMFFYFYVVTILVYFLAIFMDSPFFNNYLSILFILQLLFTIQGYSLIAFLLDYGEKNKAWMVLAIFLAFTPILTIIQFLGLVDVGFDLRQWMIQMKNRQK